MLTAVAAAAFGPPATNADNDYPLVTTWHLDNGSWTLGTTDSGTYTIAGNTVVFDWPRVNAVNTMTFRRDHDGTLHWTPVLPMDLGDQFIWAGAPWRRAGPP